MNAISPPGRLQALALAACMIAPTHAPASQVAYAGYLGGNTTDQAFAVAVDAAGDTWVAGSTESANVPVVNALQPQLNGATDAFVARISADGTTLDYATYLGGSGLDVATGIALDAAGNVYVTGYTNSGDFPVTPGAVQTHLKGKLFDAFVAKISPAGALAYATYLGGRYVDVANAIAVDGAGNAFVAGFTCSPDFPTKNAFQPMLKGGLLGCFAGQDAFLAKLDASGTSLAWSTFFGGTDKEAAMALALDAQGRAFVAGYTESGDFPVTGFPLTPYRGLRDAFVARFDAAGVPGYATYLGGTDDETAGGIAVGTAGDVYVTGYSGSVDFPTASAFQPALSGFEDGFVARIAFTATSAALVYSTYLGGGDGDRLDAIALDASGNAYLTGYTDSLDFPLVAPVQPTLRGPRDAVVVRLDPAGKPTFATYLGGSDDDIGWALAIDDVAPSGKIRAHVAGETLSTDLGTAGAFQPNAQGASDGSATALEISP